MVHHHHVYFQKSPATALPPEQRNPLIVSDHHSSAHLPTYYNCYIDLCANKKTAKPTLLRLFFAFIFFSCTLVFAPRLTLDPFPFLYSIRTEENGARGVVHGGGKKSSCSAAGNNTICCDRSAYRTDVCYMRGDVRTHSSSSSILLRLPASTNSTTTTAVEEKIKPYTRKWERSVMATISELRLRPATTSKDHHVCDVRHGVPAVVFSTGGYTGNVYHEFNDGIIPLYITSQKFNRKVVFVLLGYHQWWVTKYSEILSQLSNFPPIDFAGDKRTHCFSDAVVGLRIHNELMIYQTLMENNKTIRDFRKLIDEAYKIRIRWMDNDILMEKKPSETEKPKLVIVARNGSRAIENENEVVAAAEEVGFNVEVLRPAKTTELAKLYKHLNSCDAMVGVHGAAMTHFLFMRPEKVFVQIIPLGTDWAAEAYYGAPARKMGLRYMPYKILPRESSLYGKYSRDSPVLKDPRSVNSRGWESTKKVYLDSQNVRIDVVRFRRQLERAHEHLVAMKN